MNTITNANLNYINTFSFDMAGILKLSYKFRKDQRFNQIIEKNRPFKSNKEAEYRFKFIKVK